MKNSSSTPEDWEVRPGGMLVQRREAADGGGVTAADDGDVGPLIKIIVSHGPSHHEIHVPAHSTFGYLKEVIEQKTGLQPKQQKILFRGNEKEDNEFLHEAGVKDKSKISLLEDVVSKEKKLDEVKESEGSSKAEVQESEEMAKSQMKESEENSKAIQDIAEVREEVDKLAERVAVLEVAVNSGTKIAEEEFVVSTELLMGQLLKLDTIEAYGEARMQRKAEVRRVQNYHELLDSLKTSNSKPFNNTANINAVSVNTEWETFDSGLGSLSPPPVSSSTRITQDWERFD